MLKKALFTALATAMSSIAAALAWHASERLWRALAKEAPPEMPFWGKLFVRKPMKSRIAGLLRAPT